MEKIIIKNGVVYRPAGFWTTQVHQLLCYLHEHGFNCIPKPLGFDEQGREMVSFVKGRTSDYPLSEKAASIHALVSSARLLRAYHDISQNFLREVPLSQSWMFPSKYPEEVICHSDFAPYNIVFNAEEAIGIIDFDTAHPGPRKWDIVYALYRFAPFTNPDNEDGFGNIKDQIFRASVFCNAYGISQEDRLGIVDMMIERIQELVDFMINSAREGNKKYQLNLDQQHHLKYLADIKYIKKEKLFIEEQFKNYFK